jgi:membrane-associated PAP2 superfamily phosphatase
MVPRRAVLTSDHRAGEHASRRWALVVTLGPLLLLLAAVVVSTLELDRAVSAWFFNSPEGWVFADRRLWRWLYHYGTLPGLLLTVAAVLGLAVGFWNARVRAWRRSLLVIVLTTVIGAGLLVNAILKPYWGRPRPRQIQQFGGQWDYRPIIPPGVPGKGQSFPCGHCTMGFIFVTLGFSYRRSKWLAVGGVVFGMSYGALLSACRIVQGAHFLSDTIGSLAVILLVAAAAWYFPRRSAAAARAMPGPRATVLLTAALALGALLITAAFMTRRPVYETYTLPIDLPPAVHRIRILLNVPIEKQTLRYDDDPAGRLVMHAHGFGWVASTHRLVCRTHHLQNQLVIDCRVTAAGYYSELGHELEVTLPHRFEDRVTIAASSLKTDSYLRPSRRR